MPRLRQGFGGLCPPKLPQGAKEGNDGSGLGARAEIKGCRNLNGNHVRTWAGRDREPEADG